MKIPKTFLPEKNLEEKTKWLLEAKLLQKTEEEKYGLLYAELKDEFPNFADYIISLYSSVEICKVKNFPTAFPSNSTKNTEWHFFVKSLPPSLKVRIGMIKSYTQEKCVYTSEYGYEAKIVTSRGKRKLMYRKGYHTFDSMNVAITIEDPLRVDENKEVPFP